MIHVLLLTIVIMLTFSTIIFTIETIEIVYTNSERFFKIQCLATRSGSCDGWLDFAQTVVALWPYTVVVNI